MNSNIAKSRLSEVIKTDVITSSEADFLATHVPIKEVEVIEGGLDSTGKKRDLLSEDELYRKYIVGDRDKHKLIIVKGSSGAGKSHMIRWFAAKLRQENLDDEVVLFIRRSDNSLKGTIKQLLDLDEVKNIANRDIKERLVKASITVDDRKFKDMIYQSFIVEIRNDEGTEILTSVQKKNLEVLLNNDLFQERLLSALGPIERIYAKVSGATSNYGKFEAALFKEEDFWVDLDFYTELQSMEPDKRALKMARKIMGSEDMAKDVANYLNQFVDSVIQTSAGIESGDFEQTFNEIRQEIKRNNKNLTLLIEDITAFTGINQELLNVLITEHTGMNEESNLCRLSSIIGTTTAYYEDTFRDNYKDRVTRQFQIPDNIFGENKEDLFEFVGKYLNIMSAEKSEVENWMINEGLSDQSYPIHDQVEGLEWDSVEIYGNNISLYPFSKKAVENLYNSLSYEKRTPRNLLREVVEKAVNDIIHDKANFPRFNIDPMPMWEPTFHRQKLSEEVQDEDTFNRIEKLIRVWGHANLYKTSIGETTYVGGISQKVYEELGLAMPSGIQGSDQDVIKSNPRPINKKPIKINTEKSLDLKRESPNEKIFQERINEVEQWVSGGVFENFKQVRDDVIKYLVTAINWQAEGVSFDTFLKISDSKFNLISFERQKKASENALVILPSDRQTQSIVEAFLSWRLKGNKTWNFSGSNYMLYQVMKWTEDIKDILIDKLVNLDGRENNYFECACIAEVYRLILFGIYKGKNLKSIERSILLENNIDVKYNIDSNGHSDDWNRLVKLLIDPSEYTRENKEIVQHYYSLTLKDMDEKKHTKKVFLNDYMLEIKISELSRRKFSIEDDLLNIEDSIVPRRKPREYLKKLISKVDKVCLSEMKKAREMLDALFIHFEYEEIFEDDIELLCDKIEDYYKKLDENQISYIPKTGIVDIRRNSKKIVDSIKLIQSCCDSDSSLDVLLKFSKDPIKPVENLLILLKDVEKDYLKVSADICNKMDGIKDINKNIRSDSDQAKLMSKVERYKKVLKSLEV